MMKTDFLSHEGANLRQKAEELLMKKSIGTVLPRSEDETLKLIHELGVHQIELELQNDELLKSISAAQDAIDLYNFAPTGYFTLANNGEIQNLNLCASQMLGKERPQLINKQFCLYVSEDTRPVFNLFFDKLFSSKRKESCEVIFEADHSQPLPVHLIGIANRDGKLCHIIAIDITGRKREEENLKESEKKYRQVIEEAVDVVLTVNLDGYLTYVNPAGEKLSGFSSEELMKMKFYDLVEPDYKQRVKHHFFKQYIERNANSTTEYPFRTKSGERKWINQNTQLIVENNKVKGFYAIIRDVSELHNAEIALKESEERYRLIVENIGEGFGFVNPEERFIIANKTADEIFGVAPGGLAGRNLKEFLLKEQISLVQKETELRAHGIKSIYELDIKRSNGEFRTISVTAVPQNDKDGTFIGTYGIFRDITERKQMVEALLESEMKYRQLVENSPDAIAIYTEGIVVYANNECSRLMHASSTDELIGKPVIHFVHPDYRKFVIERMRKAASGGTILPLVEEKFIRLDGSTVDVEVKSFPIKFGNKPSTQLIVRDITERKLAEKEILLKNKELQKTNAEKDKFFSIIAHDLRGPFTGFLGLTHIMAEELQTLTMVQLKELAVSMKNSATNLHNLLENLLGWAVMQQGSTQFSPEVIELNLFVNECIATVHEAAKSKEIDIINTIPENLLVYADNNMLGSVIRNLVTNAIKFTRTGGKIGLSAKINANDNIEISISDTGIGMSKAMVDNLFRLDVKTNRRGTDGEPSTGLGLLLCKEFVEKNGGNFNVESEEGKGSTFIFTLPIRN